MACVIMAMLAARCTGHSTDDWNELSGQEEARPSEGPMRGATEGCSARGG